MTQFLAGASVSVMIRRNFIYEDAFEKLSPENGKYADIHRQLWKGIFKERKGGGLLLFGV